VLFENGGERGFLALRKEVLLLEHTIVIVFAQAAADF